MEFQSQSKISNQCCICETAKYSKVHRNTQDGHVLFKCERCSLVYLSEYTNKQEDFFLDSLSQKNTNVQFWSFPKLYEKHQAVFDFFFSQRFSRVNKYKKFSILTAFDVGIGYGFWNHFLMKNKYDTFGIDISKECINYCKLNELTCEKVSFEKYSDIKKYSLVSLFDVLEHFEKPHLMLIKIQKYLGPDSLLYIQVPNVIGFKFPFNHSLGLPHHLWQFTPKTLRRLLEKNGYEVLDYWTGVQGIIGEYENGGPSFIYKAFSHIFNFFKRGNRVQMIVRLKQ